MSIQITQQDRVTRGAGNRKPTEKYVHFMQNKPVLTVRSTKKQAKESLLSSDENSVCQVSQVPVDEDAYILKICKEQSFKKADEQDNLFDTANSTPEKGEKHQQKNDDKVGRQTLEFEDLDNILDNTKERFMKSKQLALKEQRSSSANKPAQAIVTQPSLMPKRIMSSKKIRSAIKKELVKEEPVKKVPKDRSALIGLKRTRKSRDQIYQLQKIYEDANGKPTKASLKNLAKETGLKLQQVYKWYWDTEKKNDKLQKELRENDPECNSPLRISRKILKTQYTDEFGGYSKTWFTDGLQEMRYQEEYDTDMIDNGAEENIDTGLGGLALSLGLDIEAIALELAINDRSLPPTQCLPVYIDEKMEKDIEAKKIVELNALNLEKVRQVLMKAKGTQYSPVAKCKETQCSPIIIPNVIRPVIQNNNTNTFYSPLSNASASNISSIISKHMKAQPKKTNNNPFQPIFGQKHGGEQTYTQDKIHQAFANLFGNISSGNNNAMQTPQFSNDNKHQIKAKPIYSVFDTPGNLLNNKPQANVRSVFSPIPCIPQSECSILGVRGDRNTPYTPFSRQQQNFTPKVTPQGAGAKNFKPKGDQKEEITPGQFLKTAQPVGPQSMLSRATPKNPTNVYNLYHGKPQSPFVPNQLCGGIQSPFVPKQTPKQFRMPAQQSSFGGFTASPQKHQTIINLYTQPISCSNFYNSSACNQSSDHSHGSFSQNVSPTPCKQRI